MGIRNSLGDYNSIQCFKAVITGVEDTLGSDGAAVVFTRAGWVRGSELVKGLGLASSNITPELMAKTLDTALGKEGTRLCLISSVKDTGPAIEVETHETVCSANEEIGSTRACTFTLGVIWGAIETITGQKLEARHTDSVLRGAGCDRFLFVKR